MKVVKVLAFSIVGLRIEQKHGHREKHRKKLMHLRCGAGDE